MNNNVLYVICSYTLPEDPPRVFIGLARELAEKSEVIFATVPVTTTPFSLKGALYYPLRLWDALSKDRVPLMIWNFQSVIPSVIARRWPSTATLSTLWFFRLYLLIRRIIHHKTIIFYTLTPEDNDLRSFTPYQYTVYDCLDVFYPDLFHDNIERIKKFDLVFAHNVLLEKRLLRINAHTKLVSHGAYRRLPIRSVKRKLPDSVVFVGGISKRIDFDLLLHVVRKLTNIHFYFLGERYLMKHYVSGKDKLSMKQWKTLLTLPNVHYFSAEEYPDIYKLMPLFQVAILPYTSKNGPGDYANREVTPMKVLGYFANRLPVVSTALPVMQRYTRSFPVYCTDDPDRYASYILAAIRKNASSAYDLKKLRRIIRDNLLSTKVRQVYTHIRELVSTGNNRVFN